VVFVQAWLSLITRASPAGIFLFFFFFGLSMLAVQLLGSIIAMVSENARRRRQEMEGVARRLCYTRSGKLVEASSIETGGYHTFLSHMVRPVCPRGLHNKLWVEELHDRNPSVR
jgi:hypothetical protein